MKKITGNQYEVIVITGDSRVGLSIGTFVVLVAKFERFYT